MPYDERGVGYRPPDTSVAAMPRTPAIIREEVLATVKRLGTATCDEVTAAMPRYTAFTVRPRLTELANAGRIVDTNERRTLNSGKKGIVWRVTATHEQLPLKL